MGLADWTIYRSHPGLQLFIDTASPLVTFGSFRLLNAGLETSETIANVVSDLYTPGLPAGIMRTIVDFQSGNKTHFGFTFMQSATDMTNLFTLGTCYECAAVVEDSGTTRVIRLTRYDGDFASATTVFETSNPAFTLGVPFTLQVRWNFDLPSLGGTQVIISTGVMFDYSDLSVIYNSIDPSSPTVTNGEGLFILKHDVTSESYNVQADRTQIYSVT